MTLVLLPGMEGTGTLFADLLPALPSTLNAVTVSYPRQQFLGYSDLLSFLTERVPKADPFVLLAESFSTPLAVKFAATHPANMTGLILCAGFVSSPVRTWRFLLRLLVRPAVFRIRPPGFFLEYFLIGRGAPQKLKIAVRETVSQVSAEVMAQRAQAVTDCDATDELLQVNVPILYLQATEDRVVGKEALLEIERLRPETTSTAIRGPHMLLQREPLLAAEAITEFIKTHRLLRGL